MAVSLSVLTLSPEILPQSPNWRHRWHFKGGFSHVDWRSMLFGGRFHSESIEETKAILTVVSDDRVEISGGENSVSGITQNALNERIQLICSYWLDSMLER